MFVLDRVACSVGVFLCSLFLVLCCVVFVSKIVFVMTVWFSRGCWFCLLSLHLGLNVINFFLKRVKWSRFRPGLAQRVGRGVALLFHDRSTRKGWVVSSMPRLYFTPGKDPVPILQEVGWAPGPVWTGGKSRPHRDSIPDRPARSQSLYWLSYPAQKI